MLLSIIIPVYNVERYIRGTLESIFSQGFCEDSFEVVCVNDGTPDGSMRIVAEFAAEHKNLRVVNQSNQGLSCARNAGLAIARGDYVWFVDSDDTLMPGSLAIVAGAVADGGADVIGFDMMRKDEATGTLSLERIATRRSVRYGEVRSGTFFYNKIQTCPVQRFVFRRGFLEEGGFRFFPGIYYEDAELMVRVLCAVSRMRLVVSAPYCYLVRSSGSIMSSAYKFAFTQSMLTRIDNWRVLKPRYGFFSRQREMLNDAIFFTTFAVFLFADYSNPDFRSYYAKNGFRLRGNVINALLSMRYSTVLKIPRLLLVLFAPRLLGKFEAFVCHLKQKAAKA